MKRTVIITLSLSTLLLTGAWPASGQATAAEPAAEGTTATETAPELTDAGRKANGLALIQEVLKAHGGDAFIDQRSQVSKGKGRLRPLGQAASTDLEHLAVYKKFPMHDRIEMKMPQGDVVQVFDGTKGWILNAGQFIDQTARLKSRRYYGYDVLRRFDDTFVAKQLDNEVVEDRNFTVVRVRDEAGHSTKFYIDGESKRIYQVIYTLDEREVTERYTEYREISGVQVPFYVELYQGAAKVLEFEVAEAQVDVDLGDELFVRPADS